VRPSANARYLVDQAGVPFPILGRSSWFVASLSDDDLHRYVEDSVQRGFNSLEFLLVGRDPRGNHPPLDDRGEAPFLRRLNGTAWDGTMNYQDVTAEAPDFTTPNEAYWKRIDTLLAYTASQGILDFVFPAYVGYQAPGEVQGWMPEMAANGPERMRKYGAWLAARYQTQPNLVWMLGGDTSTFNPTQAAAEAGLIEGLASVASVPEKFRSAEWESETIGPDQTQFGRHVTLNGVYSFTGYTADHGRRAYAGQPVMPAYLLEEPYDEEGPDGNNVNAWAVQPVRRFQWWGWLSTIGGYISGNGYIWPFAGRKWVTHLDSDGARDMTRLNAFIRSIPWYQLVPSGLAGMKTLITEGASTVRAPDYVSAAATPDGKFLVAYVPPAHHGKIQVDLAALSGPARIRWYDPTSAAYTLVDTNVPTTGKRHLTVPWKNSAGDTDWVLVIDAAGPPPLSAPTGSSR
jgi:hypothetical protein